MSNLLSKIKSPEDLKRLELSELRILVDELRDRIINEVAAKEGHLGASLGVVELTVALHYIFDTPHDLLIWDVGHQAYGHKILTGRQEIFHSNRQFGGISGFPKMDESEYDAFGVGHSSTSISAALGMAIASKIKGDDNRQHIAIIGDASIASGMAFEALNHAGVTNTNILVILNDNAIGIDPSIGALKQYLTQVKGGAEYDTNVFEALNFKYSGPVDGHNLDELLLQLEEMKNIKGPKLLHVTTTKGKGLIQAERDQVKYHAPGKFNPKTGDLIAEDISSLPSKYQDVFGLTLVELARQNEKIVGITPAMPTGSSLKFMMEEFPERAFDVGIAEQHAVTLAAGMATQGLIPFCNIYSTFLQRAYDQLIHDVALQKIPVVFCLDRAGLVGQDGATHHGVFDLAFLRCIPNMIIAAPRDEISLRNILYTAQLGLDLPLAIRYPRGRGTNLEWQKPMKTMPIGKGQCLKNGSEIAIIGLGPILDELLDHLKIADAENDSIGIYDMVFLKPLDADLLNEIFRNYSKIITIEDGVLKGGLGSAVCEFAASKNYRNSIESFGIPDEFVDHGSIEELRSSIGLDPARIIQNVLRLVGSDN
ncbi:MAG: 1-deoxy-D-xylulose-5-phosphate synthase [Bacteroidia bacterium]|nr:1-deoxy-D-xylulose-5-phosphate synthase [Bacteroidia bacterium]